MNLPSLEEVANAVSALEIGMKPLGDPRIPVALAAYSVETSPVLTVAGKRLLFTAGFDAAIEEYNSLDDADGAGTLGVDPKSKPPIVLTTASAWLKYRLGGSLRLDGGVTSAPSASPSTRRPGSISSTTGATRETRSSPKRSFRISRSCASSSRSAASET